jgi:anti-sigma factor RsiW
MSCEIWQSELDRYLDGELPEEQQRSLRRHLDGCTACAREALDRVQLKRSITGAGRRYQPSAEFRARITQQVSSRPKKRSWSFGWMPVAAAAVLIFAFSLVVHTHMENERRRIVIAEVADLHASNLASANPVDVVSTDKHTVKPWFQGKLPFTFDLPELGGTQFELLGGRMVFLEQEPAAHLLYSVRKHKVSVLISQDRGALSRLGEGAATSNAFHVETFDKQGLRYIVVSDAAAEDVHALAELFRRGAPKS